eukprot:1156285-Pelagomonas_calceolata.AAC.1
MKWAGGTGWVGRSMDKEFEGRKVDGLGGQASSACLVQQLNALHMSMELNALHMSMELRLVSMGYRGYKGKKASDKTSDC